MISVLHIYIYREREREKERGNMKRNETNALRIQNAIIVNMETLKHKDNNTCNKNTKRQ